MMQHVQPRSPSFVQAGACLNELAAKLLNLLTQHFVSILKRGQMSLEKVPGRSSKVKRECRITIQGTRTMRLSEKSTLHPIIQIQNLWKTSILFAIQGLHGRSTAHFIRPCSSQSIQNILKLILGVRRLCMTTVGKEILKRNFVNQ